MSSNYGSIMGRGSDEFIDVDDLSSPSTFFRRKVTRSQMLLIGGLMMLFAFFSAAGYSSSVSAIQGMLERKRQEVLGLKGTESGGTKKPNIIIYLIDDQGYADMGYQSTDFKDLTPALDAAAAEGIKLNKYYTEYVCTPARAALMTGKLPLQTGMQESVPDMAEPWGVPTEHKFLPQYLKEEGYATHMIGKWHLGFAAEALTPLARGFESFLGMFYGKGYYYQHDMPYGQPGAGGHFYDFHRDGAAMPEAVGVYSTELYEARLEELLAGHAEGDGRPLFLYYAQQLVHSPLQEPPDGLLSEEELARVEAAVEGGEDRRTLAKMAVAADKSFRHLLDQLKAHGLYEDSYVVVASDNGGCTFAAGQNYPLRGEKNTVFEGGVRVNAFVHSPLLPEKARGAGYDGLFHVADWLPTILLGMVGVDRGQVFADEEGEDGFQWASYDQWDALLAAGGEERAGSAGGGVRGAALAGSGEGEGEAEGEERGAAYYADLLGRYAGLPREELVHNVEERDSGLRGAVRVGDLKLVYGEREAGWYTPAAPAGQNWCELVEETSTQTWVFDLAADPAETASVADRVDDRTLSLLWRRMDRWFDAAAPSARAARDEAGCLPAWEAAGGWMVPWKEGEEGLGGGEEGATGRAP